MTAEDRTTLKSYFQTNDRPTQTQFENLIDSALILSASTGTGLHSTACLQAACTLEVTQSGSVIKYDVATQTGASTYFTIPIDAHRANVNATNGGASKVTVFRAYVPLKIRVAAIHFSVVTACAGGLGAAGVYSNNGASLLIHSGAIDVSTSGVKTTNLAACATVDPGFYCFAHIANLAGVIVDGFTTGQTAASILNVGTIHYGTASNTGSGGTLPTTLGPLTAASGNMAFIKING
mgnify:FL=1